MESVPKDGFTTGYWNYDHGAIVVRASIAMAVVATIFVGLRLWSRRKVVGLLACDDWVIGASLPCLWGVVVAAVLSVQLGGVGRHLSVINAIDPEIYYRSQKCMVAIEVIYATTMSLVKASVLALYRRIFPTRYINMGSWVLGFLVWSWWLAVVLVSLLQCRPLEKVWHPYVEGSCINTDSFFVGNAIPNIVTDALILAFPMKEVDRLNMKITSKLLAAGVLLMGSLVCIVSGVRLKFVLDLVAAGKDVDFTDMVGPCQMWTCIECATAVISACLPTMKPLLTFIFPQWFATHTHSRSRRQTDTNDLVTIGGLSNQIKSSSQANLYRPKGDSDTGSLERLTDEEIIDGLHGGKGFETAKTVIRTSDDDTQRTHTTEDIPLESIEVRHEVDVTWTEDRTRG